jgi:hypothetical protein
VLYDRRVGIYWQYTSMQLLVRMFFSLRDVVVLPSPPGEIEVISFIASTVISEAVYLTE